MLSYINGLDCIQQSNPISQVSIFLQINESAKSVKALNWHFWVAKPTETPILLLICLRTPNELQVIKEMSNCKVSIQKGWDFNTPMFS